MHFYSDSELKERLGGAFVPVVEPREDVMARTPPTTGAWSQWETICRRVR